MFAGGGTGGHLYPAIAIAEEIGRRRPDAEIAFVGTKGRIEATVVPQLGYRFDSIWISGFRRSLSPESLIVPLKILVSFGQARSLLRSFKPDIVVGTGGYVSGPVLFAATMMRIPTLIQEQNSYPGITTRLLASRVDEVHLSFEESSRFFRQKENLRITGNPIRGTVGSIGKKEGRTRLNLSETRTTLLVFGGSQGAHAINVALLDCLEDLLSAGIQMIWQTGEQDYERVHAAVNRLGVTGRVKVLKFIDHMEYAYGACSLALCRSGATTLSELTQAGIPSVLVPYPHAAADHQTTNAKTMSEAGASILLEENGLSEKMTRELQRLLGDPDLLKSMSERARALGRPNATAELAGSVLRLAEQHDAGGR